MLKFKLHKVSLFGKNTKATQKIQSLVGKEFVMENTNTIGDTFTMEFDKDEIKDKSLEIYKDKSGKNDTKRICIVGKKGVYIIEFIEEIEDERKGQISMKEYIKNIKKVDTK